MCPPLSTRSSRRHLQARREEGPTALLGEDARILLTERSTSGCSQDGDVLLLGLLQNRLQVGMERDGELGSGLCRTTLIFPPGGVP
jgi:hypothetical protein